MGICTFPVPDYRRAPQCSSGRAKNLPLPDSEIYVFVNILTLPELYFRAGSLGCTKQSVPAGVVGFSERDTPCLHPATKQPSTASVIYYNLDFTARLFGIRRAPMGCG